MSRINAVFEITHPNDAVPPLQTGLYVGRDGIAQSLLGDSDTSWISKLSPDAVLNELASQETRRSSLRYLYGHESSVMAFVFLCILAVGLLLSVRLLYIILARTRKQQ
jgi:hypothetical protein